MYGLTLAGSDRTDDAKVAFRQARALIAALGVVVGTIATLDLLARVDPNEMVDELRPAAQGPTDDPSG
jgi:hypothetical protein